MACQSLILVILLYKLMLPEPTATMAFASPSGKCSFIFDNAHSFWRFYLNDQHQTYLGRLQKTMNNKWFLQRDQECEYEFSSPIFTEAFSIIPLLNTNYRSLQEVPYPYKLRKYHRRFLAQKIRHKSYDSAFQENGMQKQLEREVNLRLRLQKRWQHGMIEGQKKTGSEQSKQGQYNIFEYSTKQKEERGTGERKRRKRNRQISQVKFKAVLKDNHNKRKRARRVHRMEQDEQWKPN